MSDQQLTSAAREMAQALIPFLDHLAGSGVYPRVIAVRETVRDAFGRQFVRATDENGCEEKIFTDEPLDPGAAYFMHPLTNPVRIYPILVRVPSRR